MHRIIELDNDKETIEIFFWNVLLSTKKNFLGSEKIDQILKNVTRSKYINFILWNQNFFPSLKLRNTQYDLFLCGMWVQLVFYPKFFGLNFFTVFYHLQSARRLRCARVIHELAIHPSQMYNKIQWRSNVYDIPIKFTVPIIPSLLTLYKKAFVI